MYGQRGIPAILEFCQDIREVAAPGAILFNYSNPMAMLTWAANVHGGVQTIGCATASSTGTGRSPSA
jgi:alpha-galactosidase